jgi:hypothetical protein
VSGLVNGDYTNSDGSLSLQPTFTITSGEGDTNPNDDLDNSVLPKAGYWITCTGTGASSNYVLNSLNPDARLWINPAPLSVVLNPASMVAGSSSFPTLTYTVSGLVATDAVGTDITVTPSTTATTSSPAGSYPITAAVSGANAADYAVTVTNNYLDVVPAPAAPIALNLPADVSAAGVAVSSATTVYGVPVGSQPGTVVITNSGAPGPITTAGGTTATGVNDASLNANDCLVVSFSSTGFAANKAGVFPVVETIHAYDSLSAYTSGGKADDMLLNQYAISGATPSGANTTASVTVQKATLNIAASSEDVGNAGISLPYGTSKSSRDAAVIGGIAMTGATAADQSELEADLAYSIVGQSATATLQADNTGGSDSHAYIVTPGFTGDKLLANYTVVETYGTLKVIPVALTVNIADQTVTAGTTSLPTTPLPTTPQGDTFTIGYSSAGLSASALPGYYPLRASIVSGTTNPANYVVTYVGTQAAGYSLLTVTAPATSGGTGGSDSVSNNVGHASLAAAALNEADLTQIASSSTQSNKATANDAAIAALYG